MLKTRPANDRARVAKQIRDITERDPVPVGETVDILDWCPDDGECGIWYIEWRGMIYAATPDELKL